MVHTDSAGGYKIMMKKLLFAVLLSCVGSAWSSSGGVAPNMLVEVSIPRLGDSAKRIENELLITRQFGKHVWAHYPSANESQPLTDTWASTYVDNEGVRKLGSKEKNFYIQHTPGSLIFWKDPSDTLMVLAGAKRRKAQLGDFMTSEQVVEEIRRESQATTIQKSLGKALKCRNVKRKALCDVICELAQQKNVETVRIYSGTTQNPDSSQNEDLYKEVPVARIKAIDGKIGPSRLRAVATALKKLPDPQQPDQAHQTQAPAPAPQQSDPTQVRHLQNQSFAPNTSPTTSPNYSFVVPGGLAATAGLGGLGKMLNILHGAHRIRKRMRGLRALKYSPEVRRAYLEYNLKYNHALQRALLWGLLGGAGLLAGGGAMYWGRKGKA